MRTGRLRFPKLTLIAVDLQHDLAVERASMADYAQGVVEAATALPEPVAVCGWSMGGLVVLMAAQRLQPHSLILLEPSAPAEVQGVNADVPLVEGVFDPEVEYGTFPDGIPARPESLLARAERKRGISVAALPCPSLVIASSDFPDERGHSIANLYGLRLIEFPDSATSTSSSTPHRGRPWRTSSVRQLRQQFREQETPVGPGSFRERGVRQPAT